MGIEICRECKKEFRWEEIGGGQPHTPELDDITCPECGDSRSQLTTGYFKVERLQEKKKRK
ncbi:hypothetical protein F2S72_01525 [Pseudomonas syringae pv. actinidiae]|nr:hypothetical protein [Pseudomonas syringae pv. actinidiae]